MKLLTYASALLFVGSCAELSHNEKIEVIKDNIVINQPEKVMTYANTITQEELRLHLFDFASEEFQGREVGTEGQKLAVEYLKNFYIKNNIASPFEGDDYFQEIPTEYFDSEFKDSENVLAYIEGSDKADELIVICAHHDHEGVDDNGNVYYGADDNGSGNVALLEIAEAFQKAKNDGFGPRRSILLLHSTAEEKGLHGSRFYVENPVFPLKNTVANLNIDMIGRVDPRHQNLNNENYLYLIGTKRLSTELHYISEAVNDHFIQLDLDYKFNEENDRNRYYYRSDHYNFAKENIPVIFYFNGVHDDYSQITDTADKINYKLLAKRTQLIFATAWQLANQEQRIVVDKI